MIAKLALIRLAIALALTTPPTSGETTTTGLSLYRSSIFLINTGAANRLSVGISKNPCIWPACKSIVNILSAPALVIRFATSFAEMGVLGPDFLSCLA